MKNTIIAIVSLLILLVVCFYGYEFVFKKPLVESPTQTQEDLFAPVMDVKMQNKDGVYTFVGEVELPTPCHSLTATISPSNSSVYGIMVETVSPKEGVVCAQVMTKRAFKASTPVAEGELPTFKLFIDGTEYKMNTFEIPMDANIDTYQLQMKG